MRPSLTAHVLRPGPDRRRSPPAGPASRRCSRPGWGIGGDPQRLGLRRAEVGADELAHVAEDELQPRLRLESGELQRGLRRLPEVVGVEEGDELAAGGAQGRVAGGADAGPRLVHDLDRGREAAGDLGAAVARAVVDDDDLIAGPALGEDALDRLGQVGLAVAHRDRGGDGGLSQGSATRRSTAAAFGAGSGLQLERVAGHAAHEIGERRPAGPRSPKPDCTIVLGATARRPSCRRDSPNHRPPTETSTRDIRGLRRTHRRGDDGGDLEAVGRAGPARGRGFAPGRVRRALEGRLEARRVDAPAGTPSRAALSSVSFAVDCIACARERLRLEQDVVVGDDLHARRARRRAPGSTCPSRRDRPRSTRAPSRPTAPACVISRPLAAISSCSASRIGAARSLGGNRSRVGQVEHGDSLRRQRGGERPCCRQRRGRRPARSGAGRPGWCPARAAIGAHRGGGGSMPVEAVSKSEIVQGGISCLPDRTRWSKGANSASRSGSPT